MGRTESQHQVSLKRPDGFYTADNELIDVFAPLIGIYALGVYHLLKQRAFKKESERAISLLGISRALSISKDASAAAIATLRKFELVEQFSSPRPNAPPRYEVVHAKDVLAVHPEFRMLVEATEDAHLPQERPEIRTRVKTSRVRNSGRGASVNQDADRRNSGRANPEIRTPNKEEEFKERRKEQDSTPLPPSRGGVNQFSEVQGRETEDEATVADGVVWIGAKVGASDGGLLDADEPVQANNAGDVERKTGCKAAETTHVQTPSAGARLAADGLTPVRDTLVGLLRDLKTEKPSAAEPTRDRTPRELATFFLQYLHEQFANAFSVQKPGTDWEDPYTAWTRCFEHVRVGEVEADGNQWMVVLETPRPKELVSGLTKYRAKVQLAMKKAFGREVQLVPRLEAA